jgi:hypothetical protein
MERVALPEKECAKTSDSKDKSKPVSMFQVYPKGDRPSTAKTDPKATFQPNASLKSLKKAAKPFREQNKQPAKPTFTPTTPVHPLRKSDHIKSRNEMVANRTQSAKRTSTNKHSTNQDKAADNYFAGSFKSTKTLVPKETKTAKKSVKKSRTSTVDLKSELIFIETP